MRNTERLESFINYTFHSNRIKKNRLENANQRAASDSGQGESAVSSSNDQRKLYQKLRQQCKQFHGNYYLSIIEDLN